MAREPKRAASPTKDRERYRKVSVRTWADAKFAALSPMPASGQGLWFFLITGLHTISIPGLFSAGRSALAESVGWSLEDFDRCFAELEAAGMARADWRARVVWLPNGVRHNAPESPSVVRGWRTTWPLIPECRLKWDAYRGIRVALNDISPAFSKAFTDACLTPEAQTAPQAEAQAEAQTHLSETPSDDERENRPEAHQEQEQEQEQENYSPRASEPFDPGSLRSTRKPPKGFADVGKAYEKIMGALMPSLAADKVTRWLDLGHAPGRIVEALVEAVAAKSDGRVNSLIGAWDSMVTTTPPGNPMSWGKKPEPAAEPFFTDTKYKRSTHAPASTEPEIDGARFREIAKKPR